MESYQINILNPKAVRLLKNLAELKLISLRKTSDSSFQSVVNRIRKNAKNTPSIDEITREVEEVRSKRYGSEKR